MCIYILTFTGMPYESSVVVDRYPYIRLFCIIFRFGLIEKIFLLYHLSGNTRDLTVNDINFKRDQLLTYILKTSVASHPSNARDNYNDFLLLFLFSIIPLTFLFFFTYGSIVVGIDVKRRRQLS